MKPEEKRAVKMIRIDADLLDALRDRTVELTAKFGFQLTLSQTLRYLITKGDK